MDISGTEPGPQRRQHRANIRTRSLPPPRRHRWQLCPLIFADAEKGREQQVQRGMLRPVGCQLFDFEERHRVNYGVAVPTGGGEETIDFSPLVTASDTMRDGEPGLVLPAPGLIPGARASPTAAPLGFRPEPVRTALSTALALPRSSKFST